MPVLSHPTCTGPRGATAKAQRLHHRHLNISSGWPRRNISSILMLAMTPQTRPQAICLTVAGPHLLTIALRNHSRHASRHGPSSCRSYYTSTYHTISGRNIDTSKNSVPFFYLGDRRSQKTRQNPIKNQTVALINSQNFNHIRNRFVCYIPTKAIIFLCPAYKKVYPKIQGTF